MTPPAILANPAPNGIGEATVDWNEFALYLFGELAEPAILIDRECRLERMNRSAQHAFGWDDAYLGRNVCAFVRPIVAGLDVRTFFQRSPGAPSESCELEVQTSSGHWVRSGARVRCFGVCFVKFKSPSAESSIPPPGMDMAWGNSSDVLRFVVDPSPLDFGTIVRADAGSAAEARWVGRRCYEVLYGRASHCPGCPTLRLRGGDPTGQPRDRRVQADIVSVGDIYSLVRSRSVAPRMAHVSERSFDESLVRRLVGARLESLAEAGKLSARERAVFRLLVLGRSLDEIANVLGISNRTVRFHQSNLLDKLGADSRLDLMRLLL